MDNESTPSEAAKQNMTIDDALAIFCVLPPGTWDNDCGPAGWYAVADEKGIKAYFADEADANRFRINEVNRLLNG